MLSTMAQKPPNAADVFPRSKIKAQVLQNEDVGRLSAGAIELISACSALFLRDLVDGGDEGGSRHQQKHAAAGASGVATRRSPRKRKSAGDKQAGLDNEAARGDGSSTDVVDLQRIKQRIEQRPEYDNFLEGVLDGLTEKGAPKYDAASRKRRRQQETKSNGQQQSREGDLSMLNNLPEDVAGRGDGDDNDAALQMAIRDAQVEPASIRGSREIVEDDDDYD